MVFGADKLNASPALDELSGPTAGPWRRLFLDGAVVEQQHGLQRLFHQATKFESNPIIVADQPWEGKSAIAGPYVYGTVLREGDKFRLWYQILYQGNHVGYAESTDGIHWTKPKMDFVRFEKETPTNLVVSIFSPEKFSGVHCTIHRSSRGPMIRIRTSVMLYTVSMAAVAVRAWPFPLME